MGGWAGRTAQAMAPGHGGGLGPDTKTYDSMDQFMGEVRNGKAFGRGRHDARSDEAKGRYRDALESPGHTRNRCERLHQAAWPRTRSRACLWPGAGRDQGPDRARLERPKVPDGFKNHGQRNPPKVELAKRLGYSPRVGAL